MLAAAGERGTLVLFDSASGELVKRLEAHVSNASSTGDVTAVVFDPKGRRLYSGAADHRIIRWSVPDGEKRDEWQAPARVWALAISPDGKLLASGGTDAAVTLWATETGEQVRTLEGHTGAIADGVDSLDFSPDSKRLASASFDKTARIWDVETGQRLHTLRWHNDIVAGVTFSPEGDLLATSSVDKRIVLWDADTGRPLRLFTGHENMVFGVAFDADGRRLLSASRDNTLRLWDVATGVTLRVYQGHTAGLWSVARHGDTLYTAANDQTVRRWSLATPGQWVWDMPPGTPNSAAVSPNGEYVAVGFENGAIRFFSIPSGELEAEDLDAHPSIIKRLTFNPEGTRLATAGMDGIAKLWQVDKTPTGLTLTPLHTLEGHTGSVHAVAFSPDGRTLATAGYDGRVGLFDVESGEGELFEAHNQCERSGCAEAVEFFDHGRTLMSVGYADQRIRLWDLTKQPPEPRDLAKTKDMLLWATLRPDGRQVAAVGREQVVTLHDLGPEPAEPRRLVGHEQTVYRAIYSPDSRQLATVGADMTVRLWDLEAHKELFTLSLPAPPWSSSSKIWDFDFRRTDRGECWIAVPLTMGRLALYRLPYDHPPKSLTHP
jgi:WD40 repeat protein